MSASGTTLLMPVETQVREFDSKLLLSCVAAEAGFRVVLGSQTRMHRRIDTFPRGIYLAKDVRQSKVRILKILQALGHRVLGWDEEGLVRYPPAHYYKMRVSPEALNQVACWFAWGAEDAETLRAYPFYTGQPIHETGNPRFDMLRPELREFYRAEADALGRRFGRFILVNTSFGHSNHFLARRTIDSKELAADLGEKDTSWDYELALHREDLFSRFQQMIPGLARAFPDKTVVVRPHPAESHEIWRRAAEGRTNVEVVHEDSVIPWIMASEVVVHNGCTTAVEAFLLDRPAVTYKPIVSEQFDRHLPDSLSVAAFDVNELIGHIDAFLDGSAPERRTPLQEETLGRHLAPSNGKLAAERITEIVLRPDSAPDGAAPSAWSRLGGAVRAKVRAGQKIANSHVVGSKNWTVYESRRFPGVTLEAVEERVGRLGLLLGRFGGVRTRRLSEGIFEVTS